MKQNNAPLFQNYCEKVIGKLSEEKIENFRQTKDAESRIKLLYENAKTIPVKISETNGKDIAIAKQEKTKGNEYFAKKDYDNALKSYNNGIIVCPQESVADRELLTILISNRSATYFELKQYKKVFNDIDYLMEVGDYPQHLMYKIWLRKAKCYDELQNERSSTEAYKQAIQSLRHSQLDEKAVLSKTNDIQNCMKNKIKNKKKNDKSSKELIQFTNHLEIFNGGNEYIAANPKITIEQDTIQGRYATALEDIDIGTILVEENPYCAVIDAQHALTNCQYCAVSIEQPIACSSCSDVVFCSSNCQRLAGKSFHGVECGIQKCMFESGASVNCYLALRLISSKPLGFFKDKQKKLKDFLKDECKKNFAKKKTYRSDDYDNVFFLCRNEYLRKKEELIHYTCMAIYLLRLLKFGNYFIENSNDEDLTELETYIGSLILRHLELLQFNAHEISELQNPSHKQSHHELIPGLRRDCDYENVTIGAAVYPTLALFNHSCDPCIVRYNVKTKIVVRAIKPIKAGDIIYENYGPLYMAQPLEKRQNELKTNYWFECLCQPCVEMWPLFSEMNEFVLRIPCKTDRCPYVFSVQTEDDPFLTCEYCQKTTNLLPFLKGLMVLDQVLPEAEHSLQMGQLENATAKFLKALEILFKYSRPPHPEIIKVQQRLRTCFVYLGNKSWNYKNVSL